MIKNFHILLLSCTLIASTFCMEKSKEEKKDEKKRNSSTQINLRTPKTSSTSSLQQNTTPFIMLQTSEIINENLQSQDVKNKQENTIKIELQNPTIKKSPSKTLQTRPSSYYSSSTSTLPRSPNNAIEKLVLDALKNKDYATLNYLLFLNVNETDNKNTPLIIATKNGNEEIVTLLLAQEKIDPNYKDINGKTALFFAAVNGHDTLFKRILHHPLCDPSILIDNQIDVVIDAKIIDGKIESQMAKKNVQTNIQNFIPQHKKELRFECFCQVSLIDEIKKQVTLQCTQAIPLDSAINEIKTRINRIYQEQQNKEVSSDSDDSSDKDDRQLPGSLLPDHVTDKYIKQIFEPLLKKEQSLIKNKKSLDHDNISLHKDNAEFTTSTPKIKKSKAKLKSYDTSDVLKKHQLIINATNTNNLIKLKEILNFNCHWTDQEKNSLLMYAVSYNDQKIINLLLTKTKINPNEVNKRGRTAFLIAASKNLKDILRLLMSYPAVDTSIKTKYNKQADEFIDPLQKNLYKAIQTRIKLDEAVNMCVLDIINSNILKEIDLGLMTIDSIKNKVKTIKQSLLKRPDNANKNFIFNMIMSRIKFSKTINASQPNKNLPNDYIKFSITI